MAMNLHHRDVFTRTATHQVPITQIIGDHEPPSQRRVYQDRNQPDLLESGQIIGGHESQHQRRVYQDRIQPDLQWTDHWWP